MSATCEYYYKITKKEFYDRGGFSNSFLFRKQCGTGWTYYSY